MKMIRVIPKGVPSPGTKWDDLRVRVIEISSENELKWVGRPVTNPSCPELTWPKFAWEQV